MSEQSNPRPRPTTRPTPGTGIDRRRGFTLIELVVAMLVASILAAIAIPAYSSYVRKARRTEAKTVLLDLASLEERYFSTMNTYTDVTQNLGYAVGVGWPVNTVSNYYQIQQPGLTAAITPTALLPAGTPPGYLLTVVAINDQLKDTQCKTFTVDQKGTQLAYDSGGAPNTTNCWR